MHHYNRAGNNVVCPKGNGSGCSSASAMVTMSKEKKTRKEIQHSMCSPSAHPPHHRTTSKSHFSSPRAWMNQYCAPPHRKQCVEKLLSIPLPVVASLMYFWILSCDIGSPGYTAPFAPIAGKIKSPSAIGQPRCAYSSHLIQMSSQKNESQAIKLGHGYIL